MNLPTFPSPFSTFSLNLRGNLQSFSKPLVMGILNITDDSFHDGGRYIKEDAAIQQVRKMVEEGATFIDIGASSSRPGSIPVEEDVELKRVIHMISAIRGVLPEVFISVDTFRAVVAREAIQVGADMINDISAGDDDSDMLAVIGEAKVPYVAMHKKGSTQTMQQSPRYEGVTSELLSYFNLKMDEMRRFGIDDFIIDPGFGFGKNLRHNYQLLQDLPAIKEMCNRPILVGVSRKSMLTKLLEIPPQEALNGTTGLHTIALLCGANILRVHDVKEAIETIKIVNAFLQPESWVAPNI